MQNQLGSASRAHFDGWRRYESELGPAYIAQVFSMEEEKRTERPRNRPGISAEQPKPHVEEQSIAVSIYVA